MKNSITVDKVKKIALLAHIKVTDDEAKEYAKQIEDILNYVEKLDEVDTDGLEFRSQTDLKNIFREDVVEKSLPIEDVLKNRKKKSKGDSLVINSVL